MAIYRVGEKNVSSTSSTDYSTDGEYSSYDTSTTLAEDWRQLALSYGYPYGAAYAADDAAVDTWARGVCADVLNYPSETALTNVYYSNTTRYPLTWSQNATASTPWSVPITRPTRPTSTGTDRQKPRRCRVWPPRSSGTCGGFYVHPSLLHAQ